MSISRLLDRVMTGRYAHWNGNSHEERAFDGFMLCRLFKNGLNIALHRFHNPDKPECFHSHHANCFRLILSGGYIEQWEDGRKVVWSPGKMGFLRIEDVHRVDSVADGTWTLWITFRKRAKVRLVGRGWKRRREVVEEFEL